MKVLLVDDAMFTRLSLQRILDTSEYDFTYLEAKDGEEAIHIYKREHPDLVIMDITMPGMNGIEAVKRIREIDENAKVIMCSSLGYQDKIIDSIHVGATDFVVKPYTPEKILAVVKKILQ